MSDPQKRQSYDRYGLWPPPTEDPPRHPQNNTRGQAFHPNVSTDPFETFRSFFAHAGPFPEFHDFLPPGHPRTFNEPLFAPLPIPIQVPFDLMGGGPLPRMFPPDPFAPLMMGGDPFHPQRTGHGERPPPHFSSSSHSANMGIDGGQWVSDSRSTTTINGQTTIVHERIDSSVRAFSPVNSATNPRFSRATPTGQRLFQMVIERTRSTDSHKLRGISTPLRPRNHLTPGHILIAPIIVTVIPTVPEATTSAITVAGGTIPEVRYYSPQNACPNIAPKIPPLITAIHAEALNVS